MKADQIDVFALAVFGNLKKVKYAEKTGGLSQRRGDIRETYRLDGVDFDFTLVVHAVAVTYFDMWTQPEPNAAGDFPAADSITQSLREDHREKSTLFTNS